MLMENVRVEVNLQFLGMLVSWLLNLDERGISENVRQA